MVLRLKAWESRSPPGLPSARPPHPFSHSQRRPGTARHDKARRRPRTDAGWSSPVARQAHNLKVAGSNPAPATIPPSDPYTQPMGARGRRPPASRPHALRIRDRRVRVPRAAGRGEPSRTPRSPRPARPQVRPLPGADRAPGPAARMVAPPGLATGRPADRLALGQGNRLQARRLHLAGPPQRGRPARARRARLEGLPQPPALRLARRDRRDRRGLGRQPRPRRRPAAGAAPHRPRLRGRPRPLEVPAQPHRGLPRQHPLGRLHGPQERRAGRPRGARLAQPRRRGRRLDRHPHPLRRARAPPARARPPRLGPSGGARRRRRHPDRGCG